MLEAIAARLDRPDLVAFGRVARRDWDPPFVCGDNSRLRALGWTPQFDLARGLADTIAWWDGQPAA